MVGLCLNEMQRGSRKHSLGHRRTAVDRGPAHVPRRCVAVDLPRRGDRDRDFQHHADPRDTERAGHIDSHARARHRTPRGHRRRGVDDLRGRHAPAGRAPATGATTTRSTDPRDHERRRLRHPQRGRPPARMLTHEQGTRLSRRDYHPRAPAADGREGHRWSLHASADPRLVHVDANGSTQAQRPGWTRRTRGSTRSRARWPTSANAWRRWKDPSRASWPTAATVTRRDGAWAPLPAQSAPSPRLDSSPGPTRRQDLAR